MVVKNDYCQMARAVWPNYAVVRPVICPSKFLFCNIPLCYVNVFGTILGAEKSWIIHKHKITVCSYQPTKACRLYLAGRRESGRVVGGGREEKGRKDGGTYRKIMIPIISRQGSVIRLGEQTLPSDTRSRKLATPPTSLSGEIVREFFPAILFAWRLPVCRETRKKALVYSGVLAECFMGEVQRGTTETTMI